MSNPWIKLLLFHAGLALAAPCVAVDPATDKFSISLGAFITDRDTVTRVDSNELGVGTAISFEDILGLDSSQTVFRMDGFYRFSERHRLDFSYFDLSRDSVLGLDTPIQYGDATFGVNATVETDFDLQIYQLGYTYSLWHSGKGFLGTDIGLYVADVDITLNTPANDPVETNSVTAPLPVLGLRGEYYLNDRWTLSGDLEWFALEVGDVRGHLHDFYIAADYRMMDHIAVGIAYNSVSSRIRYRHDSHNSILDWRYDGIVLYLQLAFGSISGSGGE